MYITYRLNFILILIKTADRKIFINIDSVTIL